MGHICHSYDAFIKKIAKASPQGDAVIERSEIKRLVHIYQLIVIKAKNYQVLIYKSYFTLSLFLFKILIFHILKNSNIWRTGFG